MATTFWKLYGWMFWRWWRRFWCRSQWGRLQHGRWWMWPHYRLMSWFVNDASRKPLVKRWIAYRVAYWCDPNRFGCPHCGYDEFDAGQEPWFQWLDSGRDYDGEYWGYGIQTCPRCRHEYEHSV